MKTLIKAFAVTTAMTTSTIAPMQAHAAIETLAECYNAVLTWCTETYPDMDCSNSSGLDDCDEVFGNQTVPMKVDQIFVQTRADGSKTLRFETSLLQIDLGDDDDDDREPRRERDKDEPRRDPTGRPAR